MGGHPVRTARLIATAAVISCLLALLAPVRATAAVHPHRVTPVAKLAAASPTVAHHVGDRLDTAAAPTANMGQHIDFRGAASTPISSRISSQRTADTALPRGPPAHRS
jgi:hypothetical protein